MREYHKIKTLWKREIAKPCNMIIGAYALPEFELLKDIEWHGTEKIDGCLHYANNIMTDKGLLPIGRIVEKKMPVKVLSYNKIMNVVEYKEIEYYHKEKRKRDFLCISINSKNKGNRPKYIVCTDNHKFFSNNKWVQAKNLESGQSVSHLSEKLPEELKQIILGTLLGDSSIYKSSETTRGFSIIHSISQNGYFDYKKMLLGKLFRECKGSRGGFIGSKDNRRGSSIVNNAISTLIINNCEKNNKKYIKENWANELSPIGIAFWYMDDGSSNFNNEQRARARFATNAFSYEEVELLQKMFKNKYNIDSKIFNYKGNTLCLSADSSEKLFSIIFPYICDSMKYKLPKKYRKYSCVLDSPFDTYLDIINTEILSISKEMPKRAIQQQTFQYDLSIKDNSNYFTNSILVHNTNVRIMWDGDKIKFGGKTDNAQMPIFLIDKLNELFGGEVNEQLFEQIFDCGEVCLYGEGYGAKIQKGGGNYGSVNFVLFDIKIGHIWLQREDVEDIAKKLGIDVVPIVIKGTLKELSDFVEKGFKSQWGDFQAEGIVARPKVELLCRNCKRIITKIKYKDYLKIAKK